MAGRRGKALVLIAMFIALPVAGCGATDPDPEVPVPPPRTAPRSPFPVAPEPDTDAGRRGGLQVYYVAETAAGYRLQREFHAVVTTDPASAAVREMLASPTGTDPDYRTYWPPGSALREPVRREDGEIVVDLTGVRSARMGTALAQLTVQQLVFTVQEALRSTEPVRILLDGVPAQELWGAVDISAPIQRGDPYALRSLVQIDSPADGAQVGRDVEVLGEAAVFEATVLWEVLRDGGLVQKGVTSTAEGQRFAPFAFAVTLEPGTYTVRVREDDPSDGAGRPVLTDDKTFTVVG
jgi:Immunoglobulin-like domain of bacterial spore germination/Sporulation and spore germination